MQYFVVRQGTSITLPIGPFIDLTAGTQEDGLAITQAEIQLSKNGGAFAQSNDATGGTFMVDGMYGIIHDTVDTDTVGVLAGVIANASAQPRSWTCTVLETSIFDALYLNNATGFNASGEVALIAATQASIDAIELDTGTTLDTKINTIDTLLDTITASLITASGEPGQGTPAESLSSADKISWMFKFQINEKLQTANQFSLKDYANTQVDTKATISDDGTTLTYGAMATGP